MGNKFVPLGIVLIAIIGLVVARPLLIDIRDKNSSLGALEDQIKEMNEKKSALLRLKPELASAQDQINALKLAMPAAQQIPEVLVMTEAIAKKTGLKISSINVQPGGGSNEVGVSLAGQGSYSNLFTFTEVLEKNVRPVQIKSLSIGRVDQGDMVSATVNLGILYQGTVQQQVANTVSQ